MCCCKCRIRIGDVPQERAICPERLGAMEKSVRDYAENPSDRVVKPELGTSFVGEWFQGQVRQEQTECVENKMYACYSKRLRGECSP